MKWIILLFLLFLLLAIFATRYRRQINSAIEIWQLLTAKHQQKNQNQRKEMDDNSKVVPLVKCAICGNWLDQKDALNFNHRTFYCSANCLEKSAVSN